MIEFTVSDITCAHCVRAITQAVKEVDADAAVEVDVKAKRVAIESARARTEFEHAIREAGYTPT